MKASTQVKLISCGVAIFASQLSFAGGYAGASIGKTDVDIEGFDDSTAFSIFGGYQVNENFSLEVSFIDFGESSDDFSPVWTVEANGLNFGVVGKAPVNESFAVFGKLGILMWDAEVSEEGFGTIAKDDGNDLSFAVGAEITPAENFGITFELQKYALDETDLDNLALGAKFYF